jgi:hypothetical protein
VTPDDGGARHHVHSHRGHFSAGRMAVLIRAFWQGNRDPRY